ncbi:MAG: SDR family NAD(P)-dependent oxidoreductase, partial [Myxococcota bacterium]
MTEDGRAGSGTDRETLKAALKGLRTLKARVRELESASREAIAVVGLGLRLPGGIVDASTLWDALVEERDLVSRVPATRWSLDRYLDEDAPPGASGVVTSSWGGFLEQVDGFDPDAFGVSHREALSMDPQQRLLLHVAWEALEDAGLIGSMEGSRTGVYLGLALSDWSKRTLRNPDPTAQSPYAGTGVFQSVAAGRISYALGLTGPAIALDTACSSSLVAAHLAMRALRSGECDVALAGGANLLLSPDATMVFSQMGALSPDGRCKAFDADANGYVRSEGIGVLVLKRLTDAERDNDRILAVLRGSAVNQDGRSNGLTAPSSPAQAQLVRDALRDAGATPDDLGAIEAHGTGTPLGDPIEVRALKEVLGQTSEPVTLGSIKSNMGHAETAAGLAGLAKAVMMQRHQIVPRHLHFTRENPALKLEGTSLRVATEAIPLREGTLVGVSSFGMSGTNAHVLVGPAPAPAEVEVEAPAQVLLPLSAHSSDALAELGRRAAVCLQNSVRDLADHAWTAAMGRSLLRHRAVVAVDNSEEGRRQASEALEALGNGESHPCLVVGEKPRRRPKLGVVGDPEVLSVWGVVPAAHGTAEDLKAARCTHVVEASRGLLAVAEAVVLGAMLDWGMGLCGPRKRASWPLTPWSMKRFWLDDPHEALRAGTDGTLAKVAWHQVWEAMEVSRVGPEAATIMGEGRLADALRGAVDHADGGPAWVVISDASVLTDALATLQGTAGAAGLILDASDSIAAGAGRALAAQASLALGARWLGSVTCSPETDPELVWAAMAAARGQDLRCVDGQVEAQRMRSAPAPRAVPLATGVWWILGGLGAVGLEVAEHLVAQGVKQLVLSGRSKPSDAAKARVAALRASGADVQVLSVDIGDAAAMRSAVERLGPDLRGVVHAAGTVSDAPFEKVTSEDVMSAWAPKVLGFAHLVDALSGTSVADILAVGSISGWLGIPGQTAYAMANAGLEASVGEARAAGLPARVVSFGPWSIGMASDSVQRGLRALGIQPLAPSLALSGLWHEGAGYIHLDAERFCRTGRGPRVETLFGAAPADEGAVKVRWTGMALKRAIAAEVAAVLGRSEPVPFDRGFFDLGLDSMLAVALASALATTLERPIPPTAPFDHPDVNAMAAWLEASDAAVAGDADQPVVPQEGPIAVVGMACRVPGADTPDTFWDLLCRGEDMVGPVPASRWSADAVFDPTPGTPGHAYVREGGFLRGDAGDLAMFDAAAFGISPVEAASLDPQQRLLLEMAIEACDHAGVATDRLSGAAVGVFVGIGPSDYGRRFDASVTTDLYAGTGNEPSFAAGRVAYALGVRGPTLGLNTACSTSLVTTHLACQALRQGECDMALSGGVHLMLTPDTTVELSQLKALSPTARCHTFDASADGYARGEGAGMLLLKRLADAERDGDAVLAVIRATGVNHDGPSAGLTVPSGEAQERLLRETLQRAGLVASDIGHLEAHGTGTRLGDPIEMRAVKAVYGDRTADQPLAVSSIKTHIGHLELAAGVAGTIAAIQSIRHGALAPHLHLNTPNPDVPMDWPVHIPTERTPWAAPGPRRAAVSSFGLSGTNAHLILEQAPPDRREHSASDTGAPLVWPVSSATQLGVSLQISRLSEVLHTVAAPQAVQTLTHGRAHRAYRAAVVARTGEAARVAFDQLLSTDGSVRQVPPTPPVLVGLCTGQGSQYGRMATAWLASGGVVAETLREADALVKDLRGTSLLEVMAQDDDAVRRTEWAQPALVAFEVALGRWWAARGVEPELYVGHSIGEIAAAHLAGAFSFEDAMRLTCARGTAMGRLPSGGGMLAVDLSELQLTARLASGGAWEAVDLAAVNAPGSGVVSGPLEALNAIAAGLTDEGVRHRLLTVSHAFHSRLMDPALDAVEAAARAMTAQPTSRPIVSNLTGRPETQCWADPTYWRRQVRSAVRFAEAISATPEGAAFVEFGPHPVLLGLTRRQRPTALGVGSAHRDDVADREATEARLALARAEAWTQGLPIDLGVDAPEVPSVRLPVTAWHRTRHWVEVEHPAAQAGWSRDTAWFSTLKDDHADRAIEQVSVWDTRGQRDPHMALDAGLERLAHAQERGERVLLVHDASVVGQALLGLWRGVRVELAAHWGGTLEAAEGDEVGDLTALHGCAERVQTPAGLRVRTLHRQPLAGRPVIRGTWWIVGGLGAVGRAFARALASGGAERVVLSSRTEPSEEQHAWIADLRRDVDVDWKRLDVTDAAQVEAIAASLVEEGLHGVLHAAGRTQDRRLAHLTSDDMHAVWSAKVTGAQHLAAALTHHPLDAFVLLGSAAGRLGWGGQANYGAANAALLGVVRSRREAGQTAMLLSYGPWEGAGLANDQMRAAMSAAGMTALDPSGAARRGLGALSLDAEEVLIAGLDHEAYAARHPGSESLFGWPTDEQAAETVPVAPDEHAAHALDHMAGWVRAAVGETLGLSDADQLDAGTGLFDLGLDSLLAVRLAAALEQRIGRPVPGTVAFDHPTIDALITWGSSLFSAPDVRSTGGTGPMGEPIVLVGAACRFPGGIADLESFWAFLDEGGQAIGPIPADRWNADALYDPEQGKPGHSYVREGAFLDDVRGFEPAMFGISPREARRLDPQQRLLLELAWESFEQAGLAPDRLGGERVSVHVGLGGHDYERLIASSGPPGPDDAYTGTGNDPAFAAGRVSYVFGLQGPALTFNTACSSSLVALQLGRDALRAGQVRFALAGGVRMMLTPDETLQLSQLRALSPTARCHTFDAAADGYVRGEGGGLVLMCRLSTAEELGLPILAEVAGVSTNHDGTSGGLTVPSGEAQRRLMELALDDAGLQPDDVDVVEAHGTGTPLGDPIEVGALQRVFGQRDPARPLMIGSVKTNLGHLELAAGMAGLLKLVVGMKHERFPGQVGFQTPNPSLDLTWPVHIASAAMPWRSADGRRRIGGVSAFGLSGTNAHALLASREPVVSEPSPRAAHPLLLSSRTAEGLVAQARQLKAWLTTNEDWQLEDVAYTLWVGRAALPHRAAGVASTRADLLAWLDAVVTGSDEVEVGRGQVTTGAVLPPVGLLFTGQGSQYPGMARELYDRFPVFADVVDACDQRLRELRGSGLLAVLFADAEDATVHQTGWTQPALFAVEVGLARLWESWGVVPSLVLGHSVGEIAAAHVAGVLSLEDALTLVEARGRLMQQLPAGGGMGAIFAGEEAVLSVLQELGAAVDIASLNGPTETVVSGALADVTRVLEHFEGRGVRCKALTVSHAFHSRLMDPMMEAFRAEISGLTFHPATCTVVSNLSGSVAGPEISTVDYWVHHARAAVRFSPAIAAAVGEGITCFVEVGPHPVLAGLARRALPEAGLVTLPSLRRGQPCEARLYASIAALQAVRSGVDADAFWAGSPRQRVAMPGVAWQREPYWIDGAVAWEAPPATRWVTEWVPLTGAVGSSESSTSEGVLRVSGDPRTAIGELMGWWSGLGEAPRVVLAPATSARAVWGALACIRLEEPSVRVRLIECDDANLSPAHQALGDPRQLDEVNEDWIRITAAGAVVPRLRRASAVRAGWRPHGVVLITGGSGAVGAHLAAWCKAKGSRVMLASRSGRVGPGLPDDTPTVVADVSTQEGAVAAIEAARELGTLTAIIHAAGALRDGAWRHQTPDDLDVVWGPKVGAVQALAAAWGDSPPETLVLMSSAASLLGAPGQATYGAANGAMASVAAALPGVNTVTLHYGPWSGGGMATPHLDRMAAEGILPIAPDAGASALALAVAAGGAQAVVEADFAVFAGRHSVVREMSLWRDVVAPRRAEPAVAPHATPSAVAVDVKSTVRQVVASVLGMAADALDPGVGFFDLGLDSLMAVTVSERLEARLQREVPNHVLFDHPTVDRLSRWLDDVATDDSAAAVPNRTLVVDEDPIAIVGLGVRFPGAEDVPAFWDLLSEGRCAIGEAPRDRWPELDSLYDPTPRTPGKTYTTRGGFLEQIEDFDPAFFGISRREAEAMDPSQRLLLEVSWEALERAGISPETLSGGRTGVYVGLGASEYDARFQNRAEAMADTYSGPGN